MYWCMLPSLPAAPALLRGCCWQRCCPQASRALQLPWQQQQGGQVRLLCACVLACTPACLFACLVACLSACLPACSCDLKHTRVAFSPRAISWVVLACPLWLTHAVLRCAGAVQAISLSLAVLTACWSTWALVAPTCCTPLPMQLALHMSWARWWRQSAGGWGLVPMFRVFQQILEYLRKPEVFGVGFVDA